MPSRAPPGAHRRHAEGGRGGFAQVVTDDTPGPVVDEAGFYRSDDGGLSWDNGLRAGNGDHERLGVDYSTGQFAGRMYLAAEVAEGSGAASAPRG